MSHIVWVGVALLVLAWVFARRRTLLRWWRTKPCPHLDCPGRLPAMPIHDWATNPPTYPVEQCATCLGWVGWLSAKKAYTRVKGTP